MAKVLEFNLEVNEFELRCAITLTFRLISFGKVREYLILSAIGWIVSVLFYKSDLSIKSTTNVDMPINKETKLCHHVLIYFWRYLWCNGYRCRKWTQRYEFKSWTRLIAFHIALIPLGKVWIQLFFLQLWVNSRADWFFSPREATSLGEGKLWIQTC